MPLNFHTLIRGENSKTELSKIFIPIMICQIIFWAIARSLYPDEGGYNMDLYPISRQGNLVKNPIGGYFFIIITAITGILLIFYMIFLYRRLLPSVKILSRFFLFGGITGGIGLSMVGIFYEEGGTIIQLIHNIGAALAFTGLFIAVGFSLLIMFIRIIQKRPWPTIPQFLCIFALVLHFLLMLPFTLGGSVTQWTAFYSIFVWVIGMFLIAPESPEIL